MPISTPKTAALRGRLRVVLMLSLLSDQNPSWAGGTAGRTIPLALRPPSRRCFASPVGQGDRKRKLVSVICVDVGGGRYRSGGPVRLSSSIGRPSTTAHASASRRHRSPHQGDLRDAASGMAYRRVTSCSSARAGTSTSSEPTGFTMRWVAAEDKTPKRRVKAKLRDDRAPATRPEGRSMSGPWTSSTTARPGKDDPRADGLSIPSPASRPWWTRASATGPGRGRHARTGMRQSGYPKTIRVDQGSVSSSAATLTSGPMPRA